MALSAMALAIAGAIPSPARADNPIVQTSYTADPAPMVYDGRLYLYTSHDEDVTVNNFYTMNDWRLYSTTDMVNWTDHGTPAGLRTFSWGTDSAWAPQGVARNGKFYLYWKDSRFQAWDMEAGTTKTLGGGSTASFVNVEDDHPGLLPAG